MENAQVSRTPLWVTILRIFQIIIGIVLMGLTGYLISIIPLIPSWGFGVFTSLVVLVVVIYALIVERTVNVTAMARFWLLLVLEFIAILFCLCSMAALAAQRGELGSLQSRFPKRDLLSLFIGAAFLTATGSAGSNVLQPILDVWAAAAAMSAIEMALFIATVTHTFMDIRRRRAALRQQQQQPVSVVIQMEAPKQEYPAV